MSYQLKTTEESRRGRFGVVKVFIFTAVVLILAFATPVRNFISPITIKITEPFFAAAYFLKDRTIVVLNILRPETSLVRENLSLRTALDEARIKLFNYERLRSENAELLKLKEVHNAEDFIIKKVLKVPDSTPYDTMIIEGGERDGISAGNLVFAQSKVPLGIVENSYGSTSRVKLYSTPGENHEVRIGSDGIFARATGLGGGNFETLLPRGALVNIGDEIILSQISENVFGVVENIQETEGGTFIRILFKNPVSLSNLRFVSVLKNSI